MSLLPPNHSLRPRLLVFDVNETLSDMSGLAERFAEAGVPPGTAATWFASLLRDGFALTVTGENPAFGDLASQSLAGLLRRHGVDDVDAAVGQIMSASPPSRCTRTWSPGCAPCPMPGSDWSR